MAAISVLPVAGLLLGGASSGLSWPNRLFPNLRNTARPRQPDSLHTYVKEDIHGRFADARRPARKCLGFASA